MTEETPGTRVASTKLGDVEYADFGDGPPVLVVHGTPGGCDQGALMGRFLERSGFRVIAPSRPGYLGTPLTDDNATPDRQGDLHAALLDELGVERAAVLGWSGAGPSSYRLAAAHPDRVTSLVATACVSRRYAVEKTTTDGFMFGTAAGNWLMRVLVAHAPGQVVQGELDSEGDLTKEELEARTEAVMADPEKSAFALGMALSVSTRGERKAGYENDLVQLAAIESLGLEEIEAPVLIVQGTVDTDVPPDFSRFAAAEIPGARLVEIEAGTHLALYLSDDATAVQAQVCDFLRERV